MGTIEALESIARDLHGEQCRIKFSSDGKLCWLAYADGGCSISQPSLDAMARRWRRLLAEGEGEFGADERARMLARVDAWLAE
jgi:hypothetical protein